MTLESTLTPDQYPINQNLERFANPYTPEQFSEDEARHLRPFFSNLDKPIFVTHTLPEEINAALDARYSRSMVSKRRLFLNEYVKSIAHPETLPDWDKKSEEQKSQELAFAARFEKTIDFLNQGGGLNELANTKRAREFFRKWLADFGDDSIAEMASGIHVSLEGISSLALEEVVSKRIGVSPLVKSTRYVPFEERDTNGNYQYAIPGEIRGTELEAEYKRVMDLLFSTYAEISGPYLEYIKSLYPKGDDETDESFIKSRKAKRLDDIRDLLPFSTRNNIGLSGNARAYEDLINRLLACNLGEERWIGQQVHSELMSFVPSLFERAQSLRDAEIQEYRSNLVALRNKLSKKVFKNHELKDGDSWVNLISSTPQAEIEVLAAFIFENGRGDLSLPEVHGYVTKLSAEERNEIFQEIYKLRKSGREEPSRFTDRFKKVPRAFETAHYIYEIRGRGGDKRDLHRHRMETEISQPFTTRLGFDLEDEVKKSPFFDKYKYVLAEAEGLHRKLESAFSPELAQYAVPFTFIQRWLIDITAREIYWQAELRTGPQGRPHYRQIVTEILDQAIAVDPNLFAGVMVDRNDYRLARRESEKWSEKMRKEQSSKTG